MACDPRTEVPSTADVVESPLVGGVVSVPSGSCTERYIRESSILNTHWYVTCNLCGRKYPMLIQFCLYMSNNRPLQGSYRIFQAIPSIFPNEVVSRQARCPGRPSTTFVDTFKRDVGAANTAELTVITGLRGVQLG